MVVWVDFVGCELVGGLVGGGDGYYVVVLYDVVVVVD